MDPHADIEARLAAIEAECKETLANCARMGKLLFAHGHEWSTESVKRFVAKVVANAADLRTLLDENRRMREALRDVSERLQPPGSKDWWCPTCKQLLDGSRVTYQECCDTCGTHLPSWPSDTDTLKAKIDALLEGR